MSVCLSVVCSTLPPFEFPRYFSRVALKALSRSCLGWGANSITPSQTYIGKQKTLLSSLLTSDVTLVPTTRPLQLESRMRTRRKQIAWDSIPSSHCGRERGRDTLTGVNGSLPLLYEKHPNLSLLSSSPENSFVFVSSSVVSAKEGK